MPRWSKSTAERFAEKVRIEDTCGCHVWIGQKTHDGYGKFWFDGQKRYAHRLAIMWHTSVNRPDMEVDHLCKNPACVNPHHLEYVTKRENWLRSDSPSAVNKRKTHCSRGHALEGRNLYRNGDRRECRTCKGITDGPHNADKTHCRKGHPYDNKNTWRDKNGHRHCRACHAANEARRRSKERTSEHARAAAMMVFEKQKAK